MKLEYFQMIDRVAALEAAVEALYARRQKTGAAPQRSNRTGIDMQCAFGLERAGDPLLACGHRIGRREEPRAAPAIG